MRLISADSGEVVVIGAGLAGLAAALHLAGRGRAVTVLEREGVPGGRAGRLDLGGYRADTGPTVLTMPGVIEETLAAVGESLPDRLDLVPLNPAYRARFADGSELDVHTDADAMADAVARFAGPREADGYRRLRAWLTKLYQAEFDRFIAANVDSPLSLAGPSLARLAALGAFGRLEPAVGRFLRDERLRRVFTFQSLYAGQSPQRALAVYAVIAYMDTVAGVYFPRGGMRALPDALAAAAEAAGVRFRYGSPVSALERAGARITAVRTADGERFRCDAVVLATELSTAYELLGRAPRRLVPLRAAPSAVVLHAGLRRRYPGTAHHTILFGGAWRETFREVIDDGRPMSDPSLLVTRPTATDPGLAPPGRDLLYVLAPAPNLAAGDTDWDAAGEAYADQLAERVADRLLPGLDAEIETARLVTPADWARQGLVAGTPFSYAHTFWQTGPFRPGNRPRAAGNAVLAGCGTVPGVGVPTALVSGRLAADRITGETNQRPDPERRVLLSSLSRPGSLGRSRLERSARDGLHLIPRRYRPGRAGQDGSVMIGTELDAASVLDPRLRAAYERCRQLNARHGRTYYLATKLLPPARRPAVYALYGLARWADDIVDEVPPGSAADDVAARLAAVSGQLSAGLRAGRSRDPLLAAVVDTAARYRIEPALFEDFFASMRMDLTVRSYPDRAALDRYVHGSAEVIGLQVLPVLSTVVPVAEAAPHAAALGKAFQLTNFLRDVREDLERDRVYLPANELAAHGVDRELLDWCRAHRTTDRRVRAALADQHARTREVYAFAQAGIALLAPAARPCVATALTLYSRILNEIEDGDFAVFARRATVGPVRRIAVAGPALAWALWARRGSWAPPAGSGAPVASAEPR